MAAKRYAFVNYGGLVQSIETRCAGRYKAEVQHGELALEQIIHPDMLQYYVEITDSTGDAQKGYIWSDGKFATQESGQEQKQTADLTAQVAALGQQVATLTAQNAALGKQVAALSAAGKAGE